MATKIPRRMLACQISDTASSRSRQRAPDAAPELRVGQHQDLIDNHDTSRRRYTHALGTWAQSSSCGTSRRARSQREWADLQRRRPKLQLVRGCGPLPPLVQDPPTELPRPGLACVLRPRQRTRDSRSCFDSEEMKASQSRLHQSRPRPNTDRQTSGKNNANNGCHQELWGLRCRGSSDLF